MSSTVPSPQGQRFTPRMPVGAYQTYRIVAPVSTHWRPATCAEVECTAYERGWASTVIAGDDMEATLLRASDGLIDGRRRRYTRHPQPDGFVRYVFGPGQPCFKASTHRVRLDRQEIYLRRGGDWRGNPTGEVVRHSRPEHWVEDFGEHQQAIADRIAKG